MEPGKDQLTKDGYDLTLGVNVLGESYLFRPSTETVLILDAGPFYFTKLLLPALLAVAEHTPGECARIVNTSSCTSEMVNMIDCATFKPGPERDKTNMTTLYWYSKFVCFHLMPFNGSVSRTDAN